MKKQPGWAVSQSDGWINKELANCRFPDERHGRRLHNWWNSLQKTSGEATPWAMSGLGQHQGGLPLLWQRTDQRELIFCAVILPARGEDFPLAAWASPSDSSRHDGVSLIGAKVPHRSGILKKTYML